MGTSFESTGGALKQTTKHTQIIFIDLLPVSHWLDSLIGPGGLLLVVSHLFAVPVSGWGWKKVSK
jgi:hypothetical protein